MSFLTQLLCTPLVIIVMSCTFIAGCDSSDNDSSDENTATQTDQDNPDPNGLLASLKFTSAADDARHRCLLDTFDEVAAEEGLDELAPYDFRGTVSKVWCSSPSVEDEKKCIRGFLGGLNDPESVAISVWAYRNSNSSAATRYGYRGVRNPDDAAGVWSLYFERRLADNDNGFYAAFVPFTDGEKDASAPRLLIRERFEYGQEVQIVGDITAVLEIDETPQTLLDTLVESPTNFEQTLVERLDALLANFETRVNAQSGLDADTRAAAIESARIEIGATRSVVTENALELYGLLQEQVAHDHCRADAEDTGI